MTSGTISARPCLRAFRHRLKRTACVIVYGRGVGSVFLDPKHDATIRFDMTRPGRHVFRCSTHPTMSGELLLLSAETV